MVTVNLLSLTHLTRLTTRLQILNLQLTRLSHLPTPNLPLMQSPLQILNLQLTNISPLQTLSLQQPDVGVSCLHLPHNEFYSSVCCVKSFVSQIKTLKK